MIEMLKLAMCVTDGRLEQISPQPLHWSAHEEKKKVWEKMRQRLCVAFGHENHDLFTTQ